jgi:peptide/nickel transport system permease protein
MIAQRLLAILPVLLGVSLLTFFVFRTLPGDAAEQLLGAEATPEQVQQLRAELDLSGTSGERYLSWARGALMGDFGRSLATGLPVTSLIAERLPVTIELMIYALALALGLAIPVALVGTREPGGFVDRLAAFLGVAFLSIPNYVVAPVLVLCFAVYVPLFPSIGFIPPHEGIFANIGSLTLPALALALPLFGFYSQFLRRDIVEQLQSEGYVVTAAAKGIGHWRILTRHVLRNSLFGLITIVGLHIGTLVGGAVIVEQMFALPGVGQLLLHAISTRDVVVAQGIVLVLACATVGANLLVDLLYVGLDPRVRARVR